MNLRHIPALSLSLLGIALALGGAPSHGFAQALFDYNGAPAAHRTDGQFTVGTLFTVGDFPLVVSHLGAQDSGPSGPSVGPEGGGGFFSPPISVGLWDATGTSLLATAGVLSTDPLNDSYRYHALSSPLVLSANTQYLIGAAVGGGIEWFEDSGANVSPPFTGLEVTMDQNRFAIGGTLAPPLSNGTLTIGRWAPANALVTELPEPSAIAIWSLIGLGMCGFACCTRRKK
jgi:hypothetical protein